MAFCWETTKVVPMASITVLLKVMMWGKFLVGNLVGSTADMQVSSSAGSMVDEKVFAMAVLTDVCWALIEAENSVVWLADWLVVEMAV